MEREREGEKERCRNRVIGVMYSCFLRCSTVLCYITMLTTVYYTHANAINQPQGSLEHVLTSLTRYGAVR